MSFTSYEYLWFTSSSKCIVYSVTFFETNANYNEQTVQKHTSLALCQHLWKNENITSHSRNKWKKKSYGFCSILLIDMEISLLAISLFLSGWIFDVSVCVCMSIICLLRSMRSQFHKKKVKKNSTISSLGWIEWHRFFLCLFPRLFEKWVYSI